LFSIFSFVAVFFIIFYIKETVGLSDKEKKYLFISKENVRRLENKLKYTKVTELSAS